MPAAVMLRGTEAAKAHIAQQMLGLMATHLGREVCAAHEEETCADEFWPINPATCIDKLA